MKLITQSTEKIKNTEGQNHKSRTIPQRSFCQMKLKPRKTKSGQGSHNSNRNKNYSPELEPLVKPPLTSSVPICLNPRGLVNDCQRKLAGLVPLREMTSVWQVLIWKVIEYSIQNCHRSSSRFMGIILSSQSEVIFFYLRTYKIIKKQGVTYIY